MSSFIRLLDKHQVYPFHSGKREGRTYLERRMCGSKIRRAQWKSFIMFGTFFCFLIQLPAGQALPLRLHQRSLHDPSVVQPIALSLNQGTASSFKEVQPLALTQTSPKEFSPLALVKTSNQAIDPIPYRREINTHEIEKSLPKDVRLEKVLAHTSDTSLSVAYTKTEQTRKGLLGTNTIHTHTFSVQPQYTTKTVAQTNRGVVVYTDEFSGSNPFHSDNDNITPLMELEGNVHSHRRITLQDFITKHPEAGDGKFQLYLTSEEEGKEKPQNLQTLYPPSELYQRFVEFQIETPPLALEAPPSPTEEAVQAGEHETIPLLSTEGTSQPKETQRPVPVSAEDFKKQHPEAFKNAVAALEEQDFWPLQPLEGSMKVDESPILSFKAFKILLKHRVKLTDEQLAKFTEWINEYHKASLTNVKDEQRFSLTQLYQNLFSWHRDTSQDSNLNTRVKDAKYEDLVSHYSPRRGELLEEYMSPVQIKYYHKKSPDGSDKDHMQEKEFKEEIYQKWVESPKPMAYHFEKFIEDVHGRLVSFWNNVWGKINSRGQALKATLGKLWQKIINKLPNKFTKKE